MSTPNPNPSPVLDYEPTPRARFSAGTLTYTSAGLAILFAWLLLGDFSYYLKERSALPVMLVLLRKFDASDLLIGILITTLPQFINILFGPVISYASDRHRGRFGRRIPFLLIPTPIAVLSMIGLAFSPHLGPTLERGLSLSHNAATLSYFGLFWLTFEFCTTTCNVVFNGLINDVVPRPVLGRFFALFRIFSLAAGMLFNWFLFGLVANHHVPILLSIAAIYGLAFTLMCLKVKEGSYPPPPPPDARPITTRFVAAIATYVRDCFSLPYYRWFFLSVTLAYMAFTPINNYSLYFARSLGMTDAAYGKFSTIQLFLSLCLAFPIGWLCDRFHPMRLTIVSLALYVLVMLYAFFFVRTPLMFGIAHVLGGATAGFYLTASSPLFLVLFPKHKFATFFSATIACYSAGMAATAPATGLLLDHLHHDYRLIYLIASCLIALSLLTSLVVYRKFQNLGGPHAYVPPEPPNLPAPSAVRTPNA